MAEDPISTQQAAEDEQQTAETTVAADGEGQESPAAPDGGADKSQLERELEDAKTQLLRVHADFDNFRKRTKQEKEDLQLFATRRVFDDLLPVVDNFERALTVSADSGAEELKTGVDMVYRQLQSVLEKHGVQSMDVVGQPFDPNIHNAVMQEPASEGGEAGVVSQELQKGYYLNGKVLRPAMVKVTV